MDDEVESPADALEAIEVEDEDLYLAGINQRPSDNWTCSCNAC